MFFFRKFRFSSFLPFLNLGHHQARIVAANKARIIDGNRRLWHEPKSCGRKSDLISSRKANSSIENEENEEKHRGSHGIFVSIPHSNMQSKDVHQRPHGHRCGLKLPAGRLTLFSGVPQTKISAGIYRANIVRISVRI
jgi:hypothetical protein